MTLVYIFSWWRAMSHMRTRFSTASTQTTLIVTMTLKGMLHQAPNFPLTNSFMLIQCWPFTMYCRVTVQCTYPLASLHRLFSVYTFESDMEGIGSIIYTVQPTAGMAGSPVCSLSLGFGLTGLSSRSKYHWAHYNTSDHSYCPKNQIADCVPASLLPSFSLHKGLKGSTTC